MGTEAEAKVELILHPIRMRIIRSIGTHSLATRAIAQLLPDIPQATLYRQLTTLVEGGILEVVEERRVRGAVERVYALPARNGLLGPDDLTKTSRDEHFRYFATFTSSLLGEFSRYLDRDTIALTSDGVVYRQAVLHLDDEEFAKFLKTMVALIQPLLENQPSPQRTPRLLANIILPLKSQVEQ